MEQASPTDIFDLLIWTGTFVSLLGVAGLVWCIVTVARARRSKLPEAEMVALMQRVLPRNLAALALSVIGLMLVVLGISLG